MHSYPFRHSAYKRGRAQTPICTHHMKVSRGYFKSEEEYQHLEEAWDILREYGDDKNNASNKLSTEHLKALLRWADPGSSVDAGCTPKQDMLRKYWEIHDIGMMEDEASTEG